MPSTKARLVAHCETQNRTMGDVVDGALKDYFELKDREHSAPDLVLDLVKQQTMALMLQSQAIGELKDMNEELTHLVIQLSQDVNQLKNEVNNR